MKISKKLWRIFGPLIIAVLLVVVVLFAPIKGHVMHDTLQRAANSLSVNVLKGEMIKDQAMSQNYVPFIGSSELSRMDPFHPSVLAQKYHRNYRPFLLGSAGTLSLTHYFSVQGMGKILNHRKAVVIVSPQWFVKKGVDPNMFQYYYSSLQTTTFLENAKNTQMDRYAAQRLLSLPSGKSDKIIAAALQRVADGKPLSAFQAFYVRYFKGLILKHEDVLFSRLFIKNNQPLLNKQAAKLPTKYNYAQLYQDALRMGAAQTQNNPFRLKDSFYTNRVKKVVKKLKGSQVDFNYTKSPEFSDFELLLNQFAKEKTDVLFVIPPVNKRWMEYTGLKQSMLNNFDRKITYQLRSQGFNNIADLSQDGNQPYFMEDTIHLGWAGWLKVDQYVRPFLKDLHAGKTNYHINNYFYTKAWQQRNPVTVK
ncbi:MAG: D-alanyl-lipoteichoic acid biosynthesis protein DltD [Candidatus Paralactobacillus gallistercoris]|uniref:Protein DltD n=1 Tax=Candidatus Paralactobacillus gallistercoris TaxID=2838724 RepID=A0A948X0V7_9LACO|nr:D-alanyl-lipoteichoic acid biosynthesis protein DltD [Candidatus Paralactobacillus gallistercoris]